MGVGDMEVGSSVMSVMLTRRDIRCMCREEVEAYALALQIDIGGRSLPWVQQKVYEIGNGIAPEEDDSERAFFAAVNAAPVPDALPTTNATDDEMRRRMFSLAAETVGDDYDHIDTILFWCPALPSGERADCWLCPTHTLRPCYLLHLSLLE